MRNRQSIPVWVLAGISALALAAGGCGDDDGDGSQSSQSLVPLRGDVPGSLIDEALESKRGGIHESRCPGTVNVDQGARFQCDWVDENRLGHATIVTVVDADRRLIRSVNPYRVTLRVPGSETGTQAAAPDDQQQVLDIVDALRSRESLADVQGRGPTYEETTDPMTVICRDLVTVHWRASQYPSSSVSDCEAYYFDNSAPLPGMSNPQATIRGDKAVVTGIIKEPKQSGALGYDVTHYTYTLVRGGPEGWRLDSGRAD